MPYKFESFNELIAKGFNQINTIQSLWSGYGTIYRLENDKGDTVVVKHINPPAVKKHPRNWNTDISHQRKLKSYIVEYNWYNNYQIFTNSLCKTPKLLNAEKNGDEQILILEDLSKSGFPNIETSINLSSIKVVLSWLASFHALNINASLEGLWEIGSYWNLDTRPDEFERMENSGLKSNAQAINNVLNNCKYKTIIHGDAKLANFCFSSDLNNVAAVDFQYVGGGCGIKDVAYFLGSCIESKDLKAYSSELIQVYFSELRKKLPINIDSNALITEWTALYPFACADFERFLIGWAPSHKKLTSFSKEVVTQVLKFLENDYSKKV